MCIRDRQLAARLRKQLIPMYAADQLSFMDNDKDGKVSVEESYNGLQQLLEFTYGPLLTLEKVKRVAEQIDSNQDNTISIDEYIAHRDERGNATEAHMNWAKEQIKKYDKDDDGKLSQEEQSKMLAPPKGADSNNDGFLDVSEYARYRAS